MLSCLPVSRIMCNIKSNCSKLHHPTYPISIHAIVQVQVSNRAGTMNMMSWSIMHTRTAVSSCVNTYCHCACTRRLHLRAAGAQSFQHNRIIKDGHNLLAGPYKLWIVGQLAIEGAFSKAGLKWPVGINYDSGRCQCCCLQKLCSAPSARAV